MKLPLKVVMGNIYKFYINNRTNSNKAIVLIAVNIDNRARRYTKKY